jgi:HlyD family secretion protein
LIDVNRILLGECMSCKYRKLLGSVCLALVAASSAFAQRGPAVVETQPAREDEITPTQATLGSILPTRRAVIGSAVDGRVVEFLVREGDRVEKDQPLAQLLTRTIELEVEAAEAELALRVHERDELRNGSQPEEIAQAKARMDAIAVAVQYLEKNKQRLATLGASSAVSLSELENSLSLWLESQQKLNEAKAAYQLAVDGPRPEKILQAESRVAITTAVLERLRDQLIKHTMFSRFAGYVTAEHTEVGQWLPRGEPVAEIMALDEVFVIAKVVESQIPFIRVGKEVEVEVPALGDAKFAGVVEAVVPSADERSRTFPVKIRVKNSFDEKGVPMLKAGMLARASLPISQSHKALLVHKDALVLKGPTKMVWIIDSKSVESKGNVFEANAIAVPVTTGAEDGNYVEVLEDPTPDKKTLAPGVEVVVRGNERIPPSAPGQPPSRVTWTAQPTSPQK